MRGGDCFGQQRAETHPRIMMVGIVTGAVGSVGTGVVQGTKAVGSGVVTGTKHVGGGVKNVGTG